MLEHFDTIIIGAGQAGLATSYYLKQHQLPHIVLEKDRIGEEWRSAKWDSFTLVTPNWSLRLPGFPYEGDNPDGFLHRDEVVRYLEHYVDRFSLPVRTKIEVSTVARKAGGGFVLETTGSTFTASQVVVATGTFQKPRIPPFAKEIAPHIHQRHSSAYNNPDDLPAGAVLIVGSGQSGCQIAEELNAQGRTVYLATGSATRLPRCYRGKDAFWWAEKLGIMSQTPDTLPSPDARFKANPQLTGKDGGYTLSLHQLVAEGVHLLGRMTDASGTQAVFADDLHDNLKAADDFAAEFKKGVDKFVEKFGMNVPEGKQPTLRAGYDVQPATRLDLHTAGITSVIWATGYAYDYSWIEFPIFDDTGYPVQERGVTEIPGLYFMGLHWLHTRQSALLMGVGDDAAHVAQHIAQIAERV